MTPIHGPRQSPPTYIAHIGFHGLLYAFGFGYVAVYAIDPMCTLLILRANDRHFAPVTSKTSLPRLERVRVSIYRDREVHSIVTCHRHADHAYGWVSLPLPVDKSHINPYGDDKTWTRLKNILLPLNYELPVPHSRKISYFL
ncbi:hypothetical protein BV22DRAFT_916000 [Leucogyrophana mollusca]|uniref:Uncharacterized protein n=1 Tax=Leucogyrophana mollusca TaxID=85980 RepID=A0ACB8B0D4_9AGAM|nr:hypothetical protein BV22DRAFT_916000 [Leucogyrophana mollusca]